MLGDSGHDLIEKATLQKIQSHARQTKTLHQFFASTSNPTSKEQLPAQPSIKRKVKGNKSSASKLQDEQLQSAKPLTVQK